MTKTIQLHIEGMTCTSCSARVKSALQQVDGVVGAHVNFATESARVEVSHALSSPNSLIRALRSAGFDGEVQNRAGGAGETLVEVREREKFRHHRQALITALAFGLPIMAVDWLIPVLSSSDPAGQVWPRGIQMLLCVMLFISPAGAPILLGGVRSTLARAPNMDTLITMGVMAAFVASAVSVAIHHAHFHDFHVVAMILGFINVGRYLEAKAKRGVSSAIAGLMAKAPRTAVRVHDGATETVAIERVLTGDRLRVAPDTQVPVDGRVVSGSATVDESMLTGESMPVEKQEGDLVYGGTMVKAGLITITATSTGADSAIARIIEAVEEAQTGKTHMQRIADQVAGFFVPLVGALALLTLGGWVFLGPSDGHGFMRGLSAAVAVLVIACPCAMGLATPTAVFVATSMAAHRGILIRDAGALEAGGRIKTVLFDKTGTLTTGVPVVSEVFDEPIGQAALDARGVLQLAASAEQYSQHPLAKAILAKAKEWNLTLSEPESMENQPGLGVKAVILGHEVWVGGVKLIEAHNISLERVADKAENMAARGQTVVVVAQDREAAGLIALEDSPRPGAAKVVSDLLRMGIEVGMVTGDGAVTAGKIAAAFGISQVHAQMSPEQKVQRVKARQAAGQRVAFVGDGINDTAALTAADVGISFASGADIAVEAADITLMRPDLTLIPQIVTIARVSVKVIKQNLFWAFAYNTAAIPLAAFRYVPASLAAALMMFSSISVVLNSLRLRRHPAVRRDD